MKNQCILCYVNRMDSKHTGTIKSKKKDRVITIHGGRTEIKIWLKNANLNIQPNTDTNVRLLLTNNGKQQPPKQQELYFSSENVYVCVLIAFE